MVRKLARVIMKEIQTEIYYYEQLKRYIIACILFGSFRCECRSCHRLHSLSFSFFSQSLQVNVSMINVALVLPNSLPTMLLPSAVISLYTCHQW